MDQEHEHSTTAPILTGYASTYVSLTKNRICFIAEDISDKMAAELSALLLYFDRMSPDDPIEMYIHTRGGDSSALCNIYDVMQMISAPIKTVCIGNCFSAGAVLLAAGTKGERYAFKSSKIMIHGLQTAFPIPGSDLTTSVSLYQHLAADNDKVMQILADHTGHPVEKLKKDCLEDIWMSPQQALDYGIIDEIVP